MNHNDQQQQFNVEKSNNKDGASLFGFPTTPKNNDDEVADDAFLHNEFDARATITGIPKPPSLPPPPPPSISSSTSIPPPSFPPPPPPTTTGIASSDKYFFGKVDANDNLKPERHMSLFGDDESVFDAENNTIFGAFDKYDSNENDPNKKKLNLPKPTDSLFGNSNFLFGDEVDNIHNKKKKEYLEHESNTTKITKLRNFITNHNTNNQEDRIVPPLVKHFDELVTSIAARKSFPGLDQAKDKGLITKENEDANVANTINKTECNDDEDDSDYDFEESLGSDLFQGVEASRNIKDFKVSNVELDPSFSSDPEHKQNPTNDKKIIKGGIYIVAQKNKAINVSTYSSQGEFGSKTKQRESGTEKDRSENMYVKEKKEPEIEDSIENFNSCCNNETALIQSQLFSKKSLIANDTTTTSKSSSMLFEEKIVEQGGLFDDIDTQEKSEHLAEKGGQHEIDENAAKKKEEDEKVKEKERILQQIEEEKAKSYIYSIEKGKKDIPYLNLIKLR